MAYRVLTAHNRMEIEDTDSGLRVVVNEKGKTRLPENSAYCLATLYRIKGGFIPDKIFVFRALNGIDLATLKKGVDFFFTTLLETELYIKEVPADSALFSQESARWYGDHKEEKKNGAVSIVCAGGAK
ncbi:hypothetical protein KXD93_21820 [Mucilaginibacter sp. BJC16-A38]|uniref:hypothetical protein n=1 Tax=Mucilaginibacter phenanthrenivorans TaxID=1234842 RepID=UPI0021573682|nr:hypothetical protein [Mucilaginibacter phenanthrenivorans]MCR8560306.1 hypothetical protein [Mucilaginibacter phenanthrenivorans]